MNLSEADYIQLLDTHFSLRYSRLWFSQWLLNTLPERVASSSKALGVYAFKLLETIKVTHHLEISPKVVKKTLIEASRIVSEGQPDEAEAVLKSAIAIGGEFPHLLVAAAKYRLQRAKEHTLALACSRLLEASQEDFSAVYPHIPPLLPLLPHLSIDERLSLLSLIYNKRGTGPFESVEKTILGSFKEVLMTDGKGAIELAEKVIKHPNELLRKKMNYVKKDALELITKEWPSDVSAYALLRICFRLGNDYPDELVNLLTIHKAKILPADLEYAVWNMKEPDDLESSILLAFETLTPGFCPNGLLLSQRAFERNPNRKKTERYLKLINQVDPGSLRKGILMGAMGGLRKVVVNYELQELILSFTQRLEKLHSSSSLKDMDIYLDGFMHSVGLLSDSQLVDTLERYISHPELRNPILSLVSTVWWEVKKRGVHPEVLSAIQGFMWDIQTNSLRTKIESFAELPETLDYEAFVKAIMKRLLVIPPYLYSKATSCLTKLPVRFTCINGEFVKRLVEEIHSLRISPEYYLEPYQEIKLIRTLATQRINVHCIPDILKNIPLNTTTNRPIDIVRLLEALCLGEKKFEEAISTLCFFITEEPARYIDFTGTILSALSDGNLQQEFLSAKVAEALVFSPKQTFDFTPSEAAQVLMFCVRIGMDDNTLIRKLLAIRPGKKVGRFNLKRYLMMVYFQGKKAELFSHPSEFSEYQSYIQSIGWRMFHSFDLGQDCPPHSFVNNLYLPHYDANTRKSQLRVSPMGVAMYTKDRLLGDYQFYQEMCRKECDLELTFPSA